MENIQFLSLNFEGYFACRLATDPDPTNEERGMSGYTMALATEDKLDQVIRLNVDDDFLRRNLRPPGNLIGMDLNLKNGVQVNSVSIGGVSYSSNLIGAQLNLKGKDGIFKGPIFESRNNITGSDDELSFVITPFELHIIKDYLTITAIDKLNPNGETQNIWEMTNPSIYGRRLPVSYATDDAETKKAINVFDRYGYFRDRRKFMEDEINRLTKINESKGPNPTEIAKNNVEIEKFKSRIHQIEFWGDRVSSKLNTRADWNFEINHTKTFSHNLETWEINPKSSEKTNHQTWIPQTNWNWPIKFWFGGWDGDLLTGYMRGQLNIPVKRKS